MISPQNVAAVEVSSRSTNRSASDERGWFALQTLAVDRFRKRHGSVVGEASGSARRKYQSGVARHRSALHTYGHTKKPMLKTTLAMSRRILGESTTAIDYHVHPSGRATPPRRVGTKIVLVLFPSRGSSFYPTRRPVIFSNRSRLHSRHSGDFTFTQSLQRPDR